MPNEAMPALLLLRTERPQAMYAMRLVLLFRTGRKMLSWVYYIFLAVGAAFFAAIDAWGMVLLYAIIAFAVIPD